MYAVIETGGKQYRVEVGTQLEVELLDVEPGQSITLDRVLLVADGAEAAIGTPVVDGAAVEAEVLGATRGEKVIAFKYRPKARRRVKKGHRQELTVLRIADIRFGGKSAAGDAKKAAGKTDERRAIEEAAARQAAEDAALAAQLKVGAPAEAAAAPRKTRAHKAVDADAVVAAVEAEAVAEAEAEVADVAVESAEAETTEAAVEAAEGSEAASAEASAETPEAAPRKRAARTKKDE